MKRICVILIAAALSAGVFSCQEKADDHEVGKGLKDSTMKKELDKTTKNGGDAH
jgi:hypothetical protein